jgi:outer membrane protein
MRRRLRASVLWAAMMLAAVPGRAEDLLQIYREAQASDPTIAAAKANWQATQEALPQARAGLLPNASVSGSATENQYDANSNTDPKTTLSRRYAQYQAIVSAAQPLFRYQNLVVYDQAKQQVSQADNTLAGAQQDLILRVATAYFDVLLAEYNIELNESQSAAVSEQLAQAKRNFEVGVATITDTNEAQAKYDQIVAQEIATRNDYDNKVTALRAIIGRQPKALKKLGPGFEAMLPEPNQVDWWVDRALKENQNVQVFEKSYEIAKLEVDRQRAGHYPTVDLIGSYNVANYGGGSINLGVSNYSSIGTIGVQIAVPIYQGGFVDSRVRQAIALQDRARQDLETARRQALFLAQTGFTGVTSAVASIKANEQAVESAEVALRSNRLGQEVGIRTNLDVLNVQQNVFSTRRDLAQAYFNYLIGVLRLKAAIGTLNDQDVEDINRRLRG